MRIGFGCGLDSRIYGMYGRCLGRYLVFKTEALILFPSLVEFFHTTWCNVPWRPICVLFALLRWVHTCNVAAYRNAVTLQVTDTIRIYELNFHPVHHGVTVFCERYTVGFPVCYGSPSDAFAASTGFVYLYILPFKEKEKRADGGDVSRCTSTPAQAVTVSPLWCDGQIPTTPNKPVTLQRNQLLIRYAVTSPVHTVTIWRYGTRYVRSVPLHSSWCGPHAQPRAYRCLCFFDHPATQ